MNKYVITEGPDGTFWLSLQPLLEDIEEQMKLPEVKNNESIIDALVSVRSFIAALIDEGRLQRYRRDDNNELPYKDTL